MCFYTYVAGNSNWECPTWNKEHPHGKKQNGVCSRYLSPSLDGFLIDLVLCWFIAINNHSLNSLKSLNNWMLFGYITNSLLSRHNNCFDISFRQFWQTKICETLSSSKMFCYNFPLFQITFMQHVLNTNKYIYFF